MVFCGKPSKGCSNCRQRRIKCDQVDPACSQCLRAGKECTGYRDQLSLLFRNENEKVVRKAQLPRNKQLLEQQRRQRTEEKRPSGSDDVPNSSVDSSDASSKPNQAALSGWLSTSASGPESATPSPLSYPSTLNPLPIQDEGIKFFFTHYVTAITKGLAIDLPSPPLWPLLDINKLYFNAVSSVGFAGLSNVTKNPSHMETARKKYAASLSDITTALKDTSKSDLNATFVSVMLLAAFEIVNGASGPLAASSWGIHLDGGAAILRMIGATHNGFLPRARMQIQFVFSIYIKSLSRGEYPPVTMGEWSGKCRESMTPVDAHAATLSSITCRFVNLTAEIREHKLNSTVIYQRALALDIELESWNSQLPDVWRFTTKTVPQDSDFIYGGKVVFGGEMHVYHDLWIGRVYNHYRWTRILVNELLVVHMAQIVGTYTQEAASEDLRSLEIIKQLARDICTSASTQFDCYTLQQARNKQVPPLSGGFALLFPLAVAGSGIGVSLEVHLWTIQMLEIIGNEMGISQALRMIPAMRMQRQRWENGYAYRSLPDALQTSWTNSSSFPPA